MAAKIFMKLLRLREAMTRGLHVIDGLLKVPLGFLNRIYVDKTKEKFLVRLLKSENGKMYFAYIEIGQENLFVDERGFIMVLVYRSITPDEFNIEVARAADEDRSGQSE